jgi:uncharacterized DUF497 family protein
VWHEVSWNDENEAHIAQHGVTPAEVHQVLDSDPRVYRSSRDSTRLVFGATYAGRYLVIVLADALDGRDYVVTARDMTPTENATFQRKTRP